MKFLNLKFKNKLAYNKIYNMSNLLDQIVIAINNGEITIKDIAEKLVPKKPKQTKEEQKAYRKAWRESHRGYYKEWKAKKLLQQPLTS
jgi:transcriptional regulator of acetoin/glycerol metabolism